MSDKGLLEIAHRLVVDSEFREQFLIAPQQVAADLGISAEACRALVAVAPILLAGGIGLINAAGQGGGDIEAKLGWGRGP